MAWLMIEEDLNKLYQKYDVWVGGLGRFVGWTDGRLVGKQKRAMNKKIK